MLALLGTASASSLTAWFARPSDGGRVVDDLQTRPWGDTTVRWSTAWGALAHRVRGRKPRARRPRWVATDPAVRLRRRVVSGEEASRRGGAKHVHLQIEPCAHVEGRSAAQPDAGLPNGFWEASI